MRDLRLNDTDKARLFRGAVAREQAGLLPICDVQNDWRQRPTLTGEALHTFWVSVWEDETNTLLEARDERMLAAWRLTRFIAIRRGMLQPDNPLEVIGHLWENTDMTSFVDVPDGRLRKLIENGVSMTPPDVPATFLMENGDVADHYDPNGDEHLNRFVRLVVYAGKECLELDRLPGTRRGFAWFVKPNTIRAGWPSPPALCLFEANLVHDAIEIMVDAPADKARREIRARWGLTQPEAEQVFALGLHGLTQRQQFDNRDGNKALRLAKMDQLSDKAEDALDHRGAAMIQREWWKVFRDRGEEDVVDEFSNMSKALSTAASKKRRPLPAPKDKTR